MCDIWKANANRQEISEAQLSRHVADMKALGVRWVVLSGGEALLHSNLWELCRLLRELPARITLLSTGLLLDRHAEDIERHCDEVIVSLDGTQRVHDEIRNIPKAFERLAKGVQGLRSKAPTLPVSARCVLHRINFRELPRIVDAVHTLGLDRISFLAADLTSFAFNRPVGWDGDRAGELALSSAEVNELRRILSDLEMTHWDDFASGFIAESPAKLGRIASYYAAHLGEEPFPLNRCNAPWVSSVIEANGAVRPCFFHPEFGSVHERPLAEIVNSDEMIAFRRKLDVDTDPTCRRCVCTLHLSPLAEVGGET